MPQQTKENLKEENPASSFLPQKQWFTLQEACMLKGLNLKTAYNKRHLMPNNRKYDGEIGGRKCFKRSTVLLWLLQTDSDLMK